MEGIRSVFFFRDSLVFNVIYFGVNQFRTGFNVLASKFASADESQQIFHAINLVCVSEIYEKLGHRLKNIRKILWFFSLNINILVKLKYILKLVSLKVKLSFYLLNDH